MRISREKVITICIYSLVILSILQLMNGNYTKANEFSRVYLYKMAEDSILSILQSAAFLLAVVAAFSIKLSYGKTINIIISVLLLCVCFWSLFEILNGNSIQSIVLSGVSPFIYLSVFCIAFGRQESVWKMIKRHSPYLALICSVSSVIFAVTAISKYSMVSGLAPYMIMYTSAFWFISITVFCTHVKPLYKWALVFYCVLIPILYGSRGWTITSMIMMIMYTFRDTHKRGDKKFAIKLVLPTVFLLLYLVGTSVFSEQFDYFFGRIGETTRIQQYRYILQSLDVSSIIGGGMNASYSFGGNKYYQYFDNVFIFTYLHFGLVMAVCYYLLILIPIFKVTRRKTNGLPDTERGLLYVFILWFISINGLSVYNGITYDAKNILLMLCLGRFLYISKQLRAYTGEVLEEYEQ